LYAAVEAAVVAVAAVVDKDVFVVGVEVVAVVGKRSMSADKNAPDLF